MKSEYDEGKMFTVRTSFWISAAHSLTLSYPSQCSNLHGHNWKISVECKGDELNQSCMIVDFTHIKDRVKSLLDHATINEVIQGNPTAEKIALFIAEKIDSLLHEQNDNAFCSRVTVEETDGNVAILDRARTPHQVQR